MTSLIWTRITFTSRMSFLITLKKNALSLKFFEVRELSLDVKIHFNIVITMDSDFPQKLFSDNLIEDFNQLFSKVGKRWR